MQIRTFVILLIILATAALAALNWTALSTPAIVSLGVTSIVAPLGLIMLGLTSVLVVVFAGYVLYLHSSVMLETRRHTKEMTAQRDLADKAEASRFTELRTFLEAQQQQTKLAAADMRTDLVARIEQAERSLQTRMEQSDNSVAAHVGELEDRLERRNLV